LLRVSEDVKNVNYLEYIVNNLSDELIRACGYSIEKDEQRAVLKIEGESEFFHILRREVDDKIADVICVAYKYCLFDKTISAYGLTKTEREILISSVIAADMDDDKRFVKSRLTYRSEGAIDGLYNFRLQPLKKKWREISSYIPDYFTPEELKEFVSYLIGEKHGRKVYIDGSNVYDGRCRRLERCRLLPFGKEHSQIKEALLSGASEIYITGDLSECDAECLYKYFGEKILVSHR